MAEEEDAQRDRRLPAWLDWVITIAVGVALALLVRTFVAEVYIVPSGSMLETIQEGDRLVGEKVTYRGSTPKRGDVVTFDDPEKPGTTLIKRVIATGGQTVDLKDGHVYVDGKKLNEPYVLDKPTYPLEQQSSILSEAISYPYKVPDGCIWVMGDNRTNSLDSRYFGSVSTSKVSSRALFIFWPISDARGL
ncbi:signal peptidase I [Parafannyhessea umbonata]|uniref:signal peptidase I n=1 Tax=Parafannyhessea umbonata TaxID=604330 RepID=UPI0026F19092|nr:signal peptidase I [Parafannyhessea umbonata]MDD7199953.1 signal peptidase I [Parafannyhessea umbonata]MDY4417979.1 signal peptidase I [Parafannyhessea umbonata]